MTTNRIPAGSGNDDGLEAVHNFFAKAAAAAAQKEQFGCAAPAAALRLARACYGHDNGQAVRIAACLASIYNGSEAPGVRLDEIRWLDWELQRDLITVLIGTGHAGFEDSAICEAFREVGGESAVEWLHWHTTGGPHRAALRRLVDFIRDNEQSSTASELRAALRSLYDGSAKWEIRRLSYLGDEFAPDLVWVIDGLWGRDARKLEPEDIAKAFQAAGISRALSKP